MKKCACVCKEETNEDQRIMKKGNKKEKSKEENEKVWKMQWEVLKDIETKR